MTKKIKKVCDFCGLAEGEQEGVKFAQGSGGAVVCSNCMIAMHANLWHFLLEYLKREIADSKEIQKEFEYSKTSMEHNVNQVSRILKWIDTPEGKASSARSFNFLDMIKRLDEMKKNWVKNADQKVCKMDVTTKMQIPTGDDAKPKKTERKCNFCDKYQSKVPLLFVSNKNGAGICFYCVRPIGGKNKASSDDVSLSQLVPQTLVAGVVKVASVVEQIYTA